MQTFITHVNDTLIAITYTFKSSNTNLSIQKIPQINRLLHPTSYLIHPVLSFHFNIFYVSTLAVAFHCHETTRTNANRIPNTASRAKNWFKTNPTKLNNRKRVKNTVDYAQGLFVVLHLTLTGWISYGFSSNQSS